MSFGFIIAVDLLPMRYVSVLLAACTVPVCSLFLEMIKRRGVGREEIIVQRWNGAVKWEQYISLMTTNPWLEWRETYNDIINAVEGSL